MDMTVIHGPNLERLLFMLWEGKNMELIVAIQRLKVNKEGSSAIARRFFGTENDADLNDFLKLVERGDKYVTPVLDDMIYHSHKVSPHDAYKEIRDLFEEYRGD